MRVANAGVVLPWSAEQLFDVIADIEQYPRFLPGWISARILERGADTLHVEQTAGFGALSFTFQSNARFQRPRQVLVSSQDRMFRRYQLCWHIQPVEPGCRVGVEADVELASRLAQIALDRLLPGLMADTIRAFEARALALYGAH